MTKAGPDTDLAVVPTEREETPREISIFDREDPRSIYNICWEQLRPILEWLEKDHIDLLTKTEQEIKRKLYPIDPMHEMLRLRFWQEYDRAQRKNDRMWQAHIIGGICDKKYWQRYICSKPVVTRYILCPMQKYETLLESSLTYSMDELNEILRAPLYDKITKKDGKVIEVFNTKLAAIKVDIWKSLDVRVKGAIIQKLAIKKLVQKQDLNADPLENLEMTDLEALEERLSKVQRQIKRAQNQDALLLEAHLDAAKVIEGEIVDEDIAGDRETSGDTEGDGGS